jgi:hypothetical protein
MYVECLCYHLKHTFLFWFVLCFDAIAFYIIYFNSSSPVQESFYPHHNLLGLNIGCAELQFRNDNYFINCCHVVAWSEK